MSTHSKKEIMKKPYAIRLSNRKMYKADKPSSKRAKEQRARQKAVWQRQRRSAQTNTLNIYLTEYCPVLDEYEMKQQERWDREEDEEYERLHPDYDMAILALWAEERAIGTGCPCGGSGTSTLTSFGFGCNSCHMIY